MDDATKLIQCTETKKLLEAREAALTNVLKLKVVLNEVRSLKIGAENPEIERALKFVSVTDHIRLGENQNHLLGLQECSSGPPLSYTDRKVVRDKLVANLRAILPPIAQLGDKIRTELPDALRKGDDLQLTTQQEEIIRLQKEQRACLEKLSALLHQKCVLMMKAADLKMGPQLASELKLRQAQAQLKQTKAELLRSFMIDQVFSQTDNSLKAHQEVDKYLNELISQKIRK
ncbi:GH13062 [Drosophila grimshawi]|uniref:GH13062 n=2 Tax=Drosophila grimshawi TaxID=7222 RepID=B4JR48_DROGR|nr:GH13062 [Drosophila grimshawi]